MTEHQKVCGLCGCVHRVPKPSYAEAVDKKIEAIKKNAAEMYGVRVEDDEDTNPGMKFTLEEREKMARIGGFDGYFAVCRDRLAAINGVNSVARGEHPQAMNIAPETHALWQGGVCAMCGEKFVHGHECAHRYDFPVMSGVEPNMKHVYCEKCGDLLTERHKCGGFEFL